MGTIEISKLLGLAVPFIVAYLVWLTTIVINSRVAIAVNTANDEGFTKAFDKLTKAVEKLTDEVHGMNKTGNNGG